MCALLAQPLGQSPVVWIGQLAVRVNQLIELAFEPAGPAAELAGRQLGFLVAQRERGPQDGGDVLGEANGAPGLGVAQLAQIFQHVPEALLLKPGLPVAMIIGRETVRHQNAPELTVEDVERDLMAATGLDGVDRQVAIGEDPQPGAQQVNAPTRFIRMDHGTLPHQIDQLGIHGLRTLQGQPRIRLAQRAARDRQAIGHLQHLSNLGEGYAQTMLPVSRQRFGPRPDDDPSCPYGVRDLLRVSRSSPLSAVRTASTVGHIAGHGQGRFGNVNDELLVTLPGAQSATALWTPRQRRFLGRRHLLPRRAAAIFKPALASFPAGAFALGFVLFARERGGLAFASPLGLSQPRLQIGHLLLPFGNPRQSLSQLRFQVGDTLIARLNRSRIVRHRQQDSSFVGACQLAESAIDHPTKERFQR